MKQLLTLTNRTLVVTLEGELDHHNAKTIRISVDQAIVDKDVKNLIFDFSGLSFMDSSGVGMIIGRYKQIHSLGGKIILVCKSPTIKKLVTLSGLTRLIPVSTSVENALKEVL